MPIVWITCPHCKVLIQTPGIPGQNATCTNCHKAFPVPAGTPTEPGYFYAQNRQKHGPVSRSRLQQLVAAGQLQPGDMVLQEGTTTWSPAKSVAGLFATPETVADAARTAPHRPDFAATVTHQPANSSRKQVGATVAVEGYEIQGVLGRGGMGVVYKAVQVKLKRPVALKMILAGGHAGEADLLRFRTEAEAIARLQHPNIVQIYEIGEQEGRPYFSLEFVEGGTLANRLAGTPLPPGDAARLVLTLAQAMDAAHQRGIVHRDLKPGNVLLAGRPDVPLGQCVPKIADFGLAKQLDADSGQTQSGQVMGTPSYMAPEQARGSIKDIGPATDVYALGAILYECLTGRPPFKGATLLETLEQVRHQEPVPVRQLSPKAPRDLETIALKCLEKEPGKRYATAKELAEDVARFLENKPILAKPAGIVEQVQKFTLRNRLLVSSAATVFLVLLVGIVATWWQWRAAVREAQRAHLLLTESYADAARLAVQRGNLKLAKEKFDLALNEGHPDVVGIRLNRARVIRALGDIPATIEEIDDLQKRSDLGEHEASLMLLKGDVILGPQTDEGLELIRKAVAKGLPPAEEAFAKGMLADSSPEAIPHFRRAVELDGTYHQARVMLTMSLMFLGHRKEALEITQGSLALFPEDPDFRLARAWLYLNDGEKEKARQILEWRRPQVDPKEFEALREAFETLYTIEENLYWDQLISETGVNFGAVRLMNKVMPLLGRFIGSGKSVSSIDELMNLGTSMRLPPYLARTTGGAMKQLSLLLMGKPADDVFREMNRITDKHPEATLYLMMGFGYMGKDRWPEAEAVFLKAADSPGIFNVHRQALYAAALCEMSMANVGPDGKIERPDLAAKAAENVEKMLALGPLRKEEANFLCGVAAKAGRIDLAHRILGEWEKLKPPEAKVLPRRLEVALLSNSISEALVYADRLLALPGVDAKEKRLIEGVRPILVRQLRELADRPAPR